MSLWLLLAIFLGTILTHLGAEDSARLGRCGIADGRNDWSITPDWIFGMDDRDMRHRYHGWNGSLFFCPVRDAFGGHGVCYGGCQHRRDVPCGADPLPDGVAGGVWRILADGRGSRRGFRVEMPGLDPGMLVRTAVLAALCALLSVLFCRTIHFAEHRMHRWFPNTWLQVLAGGFAIVALTCLCGTTDYNGAGMEVITAAVEQGTALSGGVFAEAALYRRDAVRRFQGRGRGLCPPFLWGRPLAV